MLSSEKLLYTLHSWAQNCVANMQTTGSTALPNSKRWICPPKMHKKGQFSHWPRRQISLQFSRSCPIQPRATPAQSGTWNGNAWSPGLCRIWVGSCEGLGCAGRLPAEVCGTPKQKRYQSGIQYYVLDINCLNQGSPTFLKLRATSWGLTNAKGYQFDAHFPNMFAQITFHD